jgi:hypothetical protein
MTAPGGLALAGAVAIEAEPEARDFYPKLARQILPAAEQLGRDIGQRMSAPMVTQLSNSAREGVRRGGREATAEGARVGNDIGAEIGRTAKARIEAALKNLPKIEIDADSSKVERKAENIRRQLAELHANIEVGLDDAEVEERLRLIRSQMSGLARDIEKVKEAGGKIPLNVDAIKAGVELTRLLNEVKQVRREAERPIEVEVKPNAGSAFENELKAKVARAQAAIGTIEIRADSSDADHELAKIAAELEGLHDARIGVDLTAEEALAKLAELRLRLAELRARDVNVNVDVNAARAEAALAGFEAEVVAVSANDVNVNVDVDTGGAIASIAALVFSAVAGRIALIALASAGGLLGTLIVPAAAAAAAAVAAIGPAAIVGLAGLGVLALGFSGVLGAVKDVGAAQDKGASSAKSNASAQNQVASALQGVKSARASLANVEANAADSTARAARGVKDAEKSLADAQRDALRAQQDITRAREQARQAMEDLNLAVKDGALSQRAALLDLAEAQKHLDEVMNNPQSTQLERQRAQLAYDQAKQQIEDLGVRQGRLAKQQQDAQKAGIEGSTQVQAAQDKAAQAQDKVAKAVEALAAAQEQQKSTARQNAFAIQQATDAVASSQRQLAQSYQGAGAAGETAAQKAEKALAKLSPAGRSFVLFLLSLKPLLGEIRGAAEGGLLPGVEAGMRALLPVAPLIIQFVGQIARAMGDLFASAGKALAAPFWVDFFRQIGTIAGPVLQSFGGIIGGLAKAFAGLVIAFIPLSQRFVAALAGMSQGFGAWAANLSSSTGFQQFIAYAVTEGPKLLGVLFNLAAIAVKLGIALAPLAHVVLDLTLALTKWLASLSPGQLIAIAAGIGAVIAVIAIAAGGPILAIVVGIGLIVAAIVYAWTHCQTFRTIVLDVWHAIEVASVWLWRNVLKPIFDGIVVVIGVVAAVVMWLWRNVFDPVFTAIGAIISWFWHNVSKPIFDAIGFVITNFLAPIFMIFWHNVIQPVWQGIQIAISIAWAAIQIIWGLIQINIKVLAAIFTWLWKNAIEPVWQGIATVIGFVWHTMIKPIFDALGEIIEKYVAPAFKRGVDAVSKAWDAIRDVAKIPVKFIIDTVVNHGIIDAYNWIADKFHVDKVDYVKMPAGFAGGGYIAGPGGPRDDAILARLSNGEFVIPADVVRRYGVGFFNQLIGSGLPDRPGDGSNGVALPAFKDGGLVGWLSSAWNTLTDPLGALKGKALALIDQIPGGPTMQRILGGVVKSGVEAAIKWVTGKITNTSVGDYTGPLTGNVLEVRNWIQTQAGKPYIWAAAGPTGYDCSGIQSAVWNLSHGRPPYSHTFSTDGQDGYFPLPGPGGVHTAGWARDGERGGGRVGHTAGIFAGLPFESRGSAGVVVGKGVTPVTNFARLGHYDSGGWLMPGITVARNDTGQPERVLTGPQWEAIQPGQQAAPAPSGGYTLNIYPQHADLDSAQLQGIVDRREALDRIGRQN